MEAVPTVFVGIGEDAVDAASGGCFGSPSGAVDAAVGVTFVKVACRGLSVNVPYHPGSPVRNTRLWFD
jgi:hypothetical protein